MALKYSLECSASDRNRISHLTVLVVGKIVPGLDSRLIYSCSGGGGGVVLLEFLTGLCHP